MTGKKLTWRIEALGRRVYWQGDLPGAPGRGGRIVGEIVALNIAGEALCERASGQDASGRAEWVRFADLKPLPDLEPFHPPAECPERPGTCERCY